MGIYISASKAEYEAYQRIGHKMTVEGNGEVRYFDAVGYDEDAALIDFTSRDMEWKAGIYHLQTDIGGCRTEKTIEVKDMKAIRVLVVPIISYYSGIIVNAVEVSDTLDDFSRKVFPLGEHDLEWICYPGVLNLSDRRYDLNTSTGRFRVWSHLQNLQSEKAAYDLIVGLVPQNMAAQKTELVSVGDERISGFTYREPSMVVSMQGDSPAVTIAHEIGHCYELGDEYPYGTVNPEKNMIPYGMNGRYMQNPVETVTGDCIYVKGGAGNDRQGTGTLITQEQLSFDIDTGELIRRPVTSFMGLADYEESEYWMTTDTWNTVYDALVLTE